MDEKRKWSPWISGIVVLLGLYVGAYVFSVEAYLHFYICPGFGEFPPSSSRYRYVPDEFQDLAHSFFLPAHRIDRIVRRKKWQ